MGHSRTPVGFFIGQGPTGEGLFFPR